VQLSPDHASTTGSLQQASECLERREGTLKGERNL
jgi:hypothetical protein